MTTAPKVYAIIPARGGSKGLSRKNLRPLLGMPLIAYSIKAALGAATVDETIVTTEDAEIAREAAAYSGVRVIDRPAELATDVAQNDKVVRHVLETLGLPKHPEDLAILLQPTSPLRRAEDIDGCVRLFRETGAASALTACEADVHPGKCLHLEDGLVEPFTNDADMEARRQDMIPAYRQNGAVYVVRASDFLAAGRFYLRPCAAYLMDPQDSVDIDDALDLHLAERILREREGR